MTETKRRVLVAYATWSGSTAGVAERVAAVLERSGFAAEAAPARTVKDAAAYDAVVLGTAVHAGKVHPDATKFGVRHSAGLNSKPFAAFVVCLTMKTGDDNSRATADAYLNPIREHARPASVGLFAGAFDPLKVGFIERQIMKMLKAQPGDFRQWDAIEAWSAGLVPLFSAGT